MRETIVFTIAGFLLGGLVASALDMSGVQGARDREAFYRSLSSQCLDAVEEATETLERASDQLDEIEGTL